MKLQAVLLSTLVGLVNAASFTNSVIDPEHGKPFELTWTDAQGPVDIVLRFGDPDNLDTVTTLASNVQGDSTTITLDPKTLPSGNYAFMIVDGSGEENYSASFPFVGEAKSLPNQSGSASSGSSRPTATSTDDEETSTATSTSSDEEETASSTRPSTPSKTSSTAGTQDTSVPGAAPVVSSPLALILVTIAAMFYFN